jgi:hypothetical protein
VTRPLYSVTACRRPGGCDDSLCATEGPSCGAPLTRRRERPSPPSLPSTEREERQPASTLARPQESR